VSEHDSDRKKDGVDEIMDGMANIENLAWWATSVMKIVYTILVAAFAWLQFRNYELTQIIQKTEPEAFLRCIMFGFYLSWVFGPSFDLKVQKIAFVKDPLGGAITSTGITLLILISLSAILMLWATQNERTFFAALSVFVALNIIGYFFIFHRMRSVAEESGKLFVRRGLLFRYMQVLLVTEFMFGPWQRRRFVFMVVSIAVLDCLCFVTPLRTFIAGSISQFVPIDQSTISSLMPDIGLLCFFTASEGWIWAERLKVSASLKTIDRLSRTYRLAPLA
jgi:hypothetical protein